MKLMKVLLIIVVLLVVVAGAGLFIANRYLQSPQFKEQILAAARESLGADVKINQMNISVFSGVSLQGIAVANPPGFTGNLLTAEAFVLRYRLWPLLHKRVEIEQLSIDRPVIVLAKNEKKAWNYEALSAKSTTPTPPAPKPTGGSSASSGKLDISLSKLAITDGQFAMLDDAGKELARIDKIRLSSSMDSTGGKLTGTGKASIETITAAKKLFLRSIASPVKIATDKVELTPLTGKLAGGNVTGDITLKLAEEMKYVLHLQVKDSDMDKVLEEAGAKRVLSGKLQAMIDLEGTGGLPTMVGKGRMEITGGKLGEVPVLNLLAGLLQVPELQGVQFSECVMDFTMTNNVMETPVIRLIAPKVQITGKGAVNLEDFSLNHDLTLALDKTLLSRLPAEMQALFKERADGYLTVEFRVWGPYDAPKTDLSKRLIKEVKDQLLNKGLQEGLKSLFKK
jgi:hypothetical protein